MAFADLVCDTNDCEHDVREIAFPLRQGYPVIIVLVMPTYKGAPIPAAPILLVMGALSASHFVRLILR